MHSHHTSFDELLAAQRALDEALLEQLWRQWRMVGASATTRSSFASTETIVDPEALVLVSLLYSHREPRLGDLIVDWATRNVDLLSVQRIRNLMQNYPAELHELLESRLAWFAETAVNEGADPRWRPLLRPAEERDALLIRAGTKRAVRAPVTTPACLLLSLRLGLGVGAKADLVAFLLGSQQTHTVRQMAQAVGYTVSASRSSVDELSEAGWLELRHGQPTQYRAQWSRWRGLLALEEQDSPRWEYWHQRFVLVAAFSHFCADLEREIASSLPAPSAVGIELRSQMEKHRDVLSQLNVASWGAHQQVNDWIGFGAEVMQRMARLLNPNPTPTIHKGD
jgi:hypothetical protein